MSRYCFVSVASKSKLVIRRAEEPKAAGFVPAGIDRSVMVAIYRLCGYLKKKYPAALATERDILCSKTIQATTNSNSMFGDGAYLQHPRIMMASTGWKLAWRI